MSRSVQAVAVDYDGTLTDTDVPDAAVLEAIRSVRAEGRAVVLVTGRILSELRAVFPGVDGEFDAIVAENGAVLADSDGVRNLAAPVDAALGHVLAQREVTVRQGRVLLACKTPHAKVVFEELMRLGVDGQVVRNRSELMVLPSGVTKGSGLVQALGNLGISRHSTLGVGDAENDHQLLAACELGAAVANAVPALKEHADLVLDEPDGAGIVELLTGPVVTGSRRLPPRRWQLVLGYDGERNPVHIPASQQNLLLTGGSCSGKSYLAGLLIEQLVALDYSVLVLDREGDHQSLGDRRGILAVGDPRRLPSAEELTALLRHRFGSLVIDLSQHDEHAQQSYLADVMPAVLAQRAVTGLPHWLVLEEAHSLLADPHPWRGVADQTSGLCLTTHRPDALPEMLADELDVFVLVTGAGHGSEEATSFVAQQTGSAEHRLTDKLAHGHLGQALVVRRDGRAPVPFTMGRRSSGHVRHWHKYIDGQLPPSERFYFQPHEDGRVAANLREFHRILGSCPAPSVARHARDHDFSSWIRAVLQDLELAQDIAVIERRLRLEHDGVEEVRDAIRTAIERRYLEATPPPPAR